MPSLVISECECARLAKAIRKRDDLEALLTELSTVESELKEAHQKRDRLAKEGDTDRFDQSASDIAALLDEALLHLVKTSFDFADVLRRMMPVFIIKPVQALDPPQVRPRAKLTLSLEAWSKSDEPVLEVSTVLDLFEALVHIKHLRARIEVKRREPLLTLKEIAAELGINHMTVKRALDYSMRMEKEGMTVPYRELHERPSVASR